MPGASPLSLGIEDSNHKMQYLLILTLAAGNPSPTSNSGKRMPFGVCGSLLLLLRGKEDNASTQRGTNEMLSGAAGGLDLRHYCAKLFSNIYDYKENLRQVQMSLQK